jgi:LysM repeat protein
MKVTAFIAAILAAVAFLTVTNQTVSAQTQTTQTKKPNMVEIQPGDYLDKIAKANDTTYHRLFDANDFVKNPDLIYPGDKLRIPAADEQLTKRALPSTAPVRPTAEPKAVRQSAPAQPKRTTQTQAQPQRRAAQPVSSAPAVASGSVWDRLAQCESGGNWHINTGNGYYGGLQFLPSTWRAVGGTGLPHQHSREEQIKRAQILLERAGWGQWPACSAKLGLR